MSQTIVAPPAIEKSLRVLQIGGGWFPERAGGLDRYYFDLMRALPAAGVERSGLVVGSPRVAVDSDGIVRAYAEPDSSLPHRWRAVRRACRQSIAEASPDLLVTHFAPYAAPLIGSHAMPLVTHFHGPWAAESAREGSGRLSTRLKWMIERAVYSRAERLIVLSRAFRDLLVRDYRIEAARIDVIPGGVNVARFAAAAGLSRADARAKLEWPTDRPIVLAVRRLAVRMGLERLIDAMRRVVSDVPDALCLIAGRGRLEAALLEQIRSTSLPNSVRLLGFVPDEELPTAYRAADVSIMPSEGLEGFGLSAVESLATGTPVLVTRVGGLPEVVEALSPRLVFSEARDGLSEGLTAALRDSTELPTAEECMRYANMHFGWENIARRIADVYRGVVRARQ